MRASIRGLLLSGVFAGTALGLGACRGGDRDIEMSDGLSSSAEGRGEHGFSGVERHSGQQKREAGNPWVDRNVRSYDPGIGGAGLGPEIPAEQYPRSPYDRAPPDQEVVRVGPPPMGNDIGVPLTRPGIGRTGRSTYAGPQPSTPPLAPTPEEQTPPGGQGAAQPQPGTAPAQGGH